MMTWAQSFVSGFRNFFTAPQYSRDRLLLVWVALAVAGYTVLIKNTISVLSHPLLFIAGFAGSLLGAFWYEFKVSDLRGSLCRMAAMATIFLLAACAAPYLRMLYFFLLDELRTDPLTIATLGQELLDVAGHRLVGIGGGFAISLFILRAVLFPLVTRLFRWLLNITSADNTLCPHCQQPLPY